VSSLATGTNAVAGVSGIYIASKVAHAVKWRDLRDVEGEPIISTWIDEAGVGESASLKDLWHRCVHEASNAAALIIYREPGEILKGAWVELGAALANGVPVFAVGIEEFTVANHVGITHCADLFSARRLANVSIRHRLSCIEAGPGEVAEWITEPSGLSVATVVHDDFSLVEIVKSRNTRLARILTIHRTSEDSGRREDLSIDLTEDEARLVAAALSPIGVEAEPAATHRHVKRGTEYVLVGIGKMQAEGWQETLTYGPVDMREVAVYCSATDPTEIWVRPREEFEDGRFYALANQGGGK